jgi:hypothetical protein
VIGIHNGRVLGVEGRAGGGSTKPPEPSEHDGELVLSQQKGATFYDLDVTFPFVVRVILSSVFALNKGLLAMFRTQRRRVIASQIPPHTATHASMCYHLPHNTVSDRWPAACPATRMGDHMDEARSTPPSVPPWAPSLLDRAT